VDSNYVIASFLAMTFVMNYYNLFTPSFPTFQKINDLSQIAPIGGKSIFVFAAKNKNLWKEKRELPLLKKPKVSLLIKIVR